MDKTTSSDAKGCRGCRACDGPADKAGAGDVQGPRLSAGAVGMFLPPLVLSTVGAAVCSGARPWVQWVACLGGLVAGLGLSVVIGRRFGLSGGKA